MNILSIDQGTSGTKALVWNPDDGVVAAAEVPVRPRYAEGGAVEQSPAELLSSVLDAGRQACEAAGRPVDAVALANQGETVMAWDRDTGRPLSDAIVWQDRRAESVCRELADEAAFLEHETGLALDPYFSAPKMAWLRREGLSAGVVTTSDVWLLHQLTGEFVTDRATASRSMLVKLDEEEWNDELLDLFGLGAEDLPRIAACDEVVGTTEAFGASTPVAGVVVDQPAALFAEGCLGSGDVKCTYGTGAFLLANTATAPVLSASGLTSSVAWRARNVTAHCLDGQVYTAASAIRWLQDVGLIGGAAELDSVAAGDAADVLCVPAFAGLGGPWWQPDATASFDGLRLSTGRGEIVLSVLQGIAAQVAELCRLVADDLGKPLTRLRVDGGLTRSARLMQTQADLSQLPVEVFPSAHATALGAAGLARLAVEPQLRLDEALPGAGAAITYEPQWSLDRAAEYLDRWTTAVERHRTQEPIQ
ncbi:FGGY family carbohydrate kinase [Kribbella sp. NPDC050124]|uniref:FGGY family carbohydrate kinase n=1 Tax=Kribbella sp. NPDC050124 TaxID=3364114 RepID=UPI00378B206F